MVLFIPGFMQRGDAWRPVAELLPERYPSTMLDHSEHSFESRLAEIAEAGAGGVLVGYSLGGRLALRAALRSTGLFSAVVTVGATAGIEEGPLRVARAEADEKLAVVDGDGVDGGRGVAVGAPADVRGPVRRPCRGPTLRTALSHDQRSLALLLRTAGRGALEPVWHDLRSLELPLLAIAGARDERLRARGEAHRRVDRAEGRSAIVEEAGHAPQLQQPDEVARLISEFLDAALRR